MFIDILIAITLLSLLIVLIPAKYKSWFATALIIISAVAASFEAIKVLSLGIETTIELGALTLFGRQYATIDSLSALFLLIIGVGGTATSIYSIGYMKHHLDKQNPISFTIHHIAMVLMVLSMMAVVVMRSGFGFILSWEVMTISSFVLILFEAHRREIIRAALSYLLIMHVGFVMLLIGFITLISKGLSPDIDSFGAYFSMEGTDPVPMFIVLLIGFGLKAGIFPLHWVKPITDPVAPSHVSALMSGVMVKTGVYGVLRVVCAINTSLYTIGLIVLIVGLVTGLWGIVMASAQNNIKRLLAYSSIENIGIIFIGIGISILGRHWENSAMTICGMGGALLHTLNHSLFKPMLFMGAGSVEQATGSLNMDRLGGLSQRMPITALLFFVASAAISALPPLNGFVSEFLIYSGLFKAISTGGAQSIVAITTLLFLALIGGIVVLSFTKLYGVVFSGAARTKLSERAKEVNSEMIVASVIPLSGVLLIGLLPIFSYRIVLDIAAKVCNCSTYSEIVESTTNSAAKITLIALLFIAITLLLLWLRGSVLKNKTNSSSAVWGCGSTITTRKMQYTGESFSDELHSLTESVTRDKLDTVNSSQSDIFPHSGNFEIKHKDKVESLFTKWWVELIRVINSKIELFETHRVNHYILYVLGFLVLILVLSILNIL